MILAVLYVIGGVDSRVRIGGKVEHETEGLGTVIKISLNSKVTVLFESSNEISLCKLEDLQPVSSLLVI